VDESPAGACQETQATRTSERSRFGVVIAGLNGGLRQLQITVLIEGNLLGIAN
jgi:hypothetical protein